MILKIQNAVKSVPSVELMRLLGASSSRGQDELIGQFGSGFLYSLALLSRHGLLESLKVCLGTDVYTFSRKAHAVTDSAGNADVRSEIVMKKQGGATIPLGIDTQFGAIDWTCPTMAVRELISNAIDGARSFNGSTDSVVIESESTSTRAKAGVITIYLRTDAAIDDYIRDIPKTFLCLAPGYNGAKVLPNIDGGPARIYRKGVLVGSFGDRSLFHYDLPDIQLKESRNVDSYHAREKACHAIMQNHDDAIMQQFITSAVLRRDSGYWEAGFSEWTIKWLAGYNSPEAKAAWKTAARAAIGGAVMVENDVTDKIVRGKGKETIRISGDLAEALHTGGIATSSEVLDAHELQGHDIIPANDNVKAVLARVWGLCQELGVTQGKPCPTAYCFRQHSVEGGMLGYYADGAVYIRTDIQDDNGLMLAQTMIEEVSHYITGAEDCTRSFQDFAFRLAASMMSYF